MTGIVGMLGIMAMGFAMVAGLYIAVGLKGFVGAFIGAIMGTSIAPRGVMIGASMAKGLKASMLVWAWAGRMGASKAARAR
jgi:hypothetical protein